MLCPLCFLADSDESLLLGSDWPWAVSDIIVHIVRNILPFQVSLGNGNT